MPLVCQIHQLVLRYLEVNVQNCFCPCGCASQLSWAIGWLCDWEGQPPGVLVVSGTRSVEEREEIERIVKNPLRGDWPELRFEKCLDAVTLDSRPNLHRLLNLRGGSTGQWQGVLGRSEG
jgi:hypothetical protein